MNRYATIIGIIMIGLSFYSIGSVICNVLKPGCVGTEHYLAVLPYFLAMLILGLIFLLMGLKSISLTSFSKN